MLATLIPNFCSTTGANQPTNHNLPLKQDKETRAACIGDIGGFYMRPVICAWTSSLLHWLTEASQELRNCLFEPYLKIYEWYLGSVACTAWVILLSYSKERLVDWEGGCLTQYFAAWRCEQDFWRGESHHMCAGLLPSFKKRDWLNGL